LNYLTKNRIKPIILSTSWLALSLCGIFITSYIFNYKGTGIFLGISAFMIVTHLVVGDYRLNDLPIPYVLLVSLIIYLIVSSFIFSFEHTDSGRVGRLVKFLIIVFSLHIISQSKTNKLIIQIPVIVLVLSILWQYIAHFLFKMPYGTFTNPHYLSNFVLLTLPLSYYFLWSSKKNYKVLFLALCLMDIQLLILSGSRTAIIGIIFSILFIVLLIGRTRIKIAGTLLLLSFVFLLYLTDYADISSRFYELFSNIQNEERTILWPLGWKLLSGNSLIEWLFGNGLGEIAHSIPATSHQLWPADSFPHLSIIELLYENGIIGAFFIVSGLISIFILVVQFVISAGNTNERILFECIIITFLSFFFHTGLTMHFYSKQTLYSLAFILGLAFPLMFQLRENKQVH
jgi:hypothetical protein